MSMRVYAHGMLDVFPSTRNYLVHIRWHFILHAYSNSTKISSIYNSISLCQTLLFCVPLLCHRLICPTQQSSQAGTIHISPTHERGRRFYDLVDLMNSFCVVRQNNKCFGEGITDINNVCVPEQRQCREIKTRKQAVYPMQTNI